MAKKWSEVVSSEAYKKLPEPEKAAAQEQYFSQIIAPQVPEADVGVAREQFFNYVSGNAPTQVAKPPEQFQTQVAAPPVAVAKPIPKNVGGPEDLLSGQNFGDDSGAAYTAPVKKPDRLADSVVSQGVMPSGPPKKAGFTPVKPEVLAAFEANYDAATPKQRKIMEAQPGWRGDIARSRGEESARKDEILNKLPLNSPVRNRLEDLDTRAEYRKRALISQGEKPEFAETIATDAAAAGVPAGKEMDYARSQGVAGKTDFDFEMFKQYQNAPTIVRGAVQGYEGFKQGVSGLNEFAGDVLGLEDYSRAQALAAKESKGKVESMGRNANYMGRMFEGAISSIAQQMPGLFAGVATGSGAVTLSTMFVNTFGQEYSEGKAKGLSGGEATTRAGLFGAFEVMGERFGLKFAMDNLSRATKGMKTDELKEFLANTLKRELPGEYLTTTGQFLTDKSAIGLNQDATLKDYLGQLADTTVQTLMQSGVMTGATKGIEKSVSVLAGRPAIEEPAPIPSAEEIMREKGFLKGATKKGESALETEAGENAAAKIEPTTKRVEPTLEGAVTEVKPTSEKRVEPTMAEPTVEEKATVRQQKVDALATQIIERQGIPAEDAVRIAENRVRAQEQEEIKQQDRMQKEVEGRATLVEAPAGRVEELTQDLIGAGIPPAEAAQRAQAIAQEEVENDKLAQAEAKGGKRAGKPILETSESGIGLPSEREAGVLAGGTTEAISTGLGDTGADVGEPTVRKTVQPDTLTEEETDVIATAQAEQTEEEGQEAPAAGAPKKIGRPALAPDLKAVSEQKRTQQRAAYKATEAQLNKAQQMFAEANTPIDEDAVESEEQLREMVDEKRRKRNSAIRRLYDISKVNKGKPGQRAAQALKDPSITPRELVEAAEGHELRKKAGISDISAMSKTIEAAAANTVADAKLGKVTNGAQAITHIIKTGNEFQKILARRIRSTVSGVQIVVVESNQPTPEIFLKNPQYEREWNRARALFIENDFTKKKVIYVRGASFGGDQGVNNITMLHELLHAATNRKIQLAQQAINNGQFDDKPLINALAELNEVMNNAGDRFNELSAQGSLPRHIALLAERGAIFDDPREFLAYGMTDPAMQDFLKTAYGVGSTVGYFNQFVDSIRNFFKMGVNDANALADLINATDAILTARAVGKLEPLGAQALPSIKDLLGFGKKDDTKSFEGESVDVKTGANVRRLATMLGAKLYGTPDTIAKVSVKELFQNSFDAIKGAIEKGQLTKGKVALKLDKDNRTITITDNGLGMPASVMGNQFLQIAGTSKETSRASGGLGVAKMLFLYENKKLEVVSLRDGQLARMVTTGEDLKASLDDPSRAPKLITTRDPKAIAQYKDMFPEGHGTTVVVQIPESYTDTSTGEEKTIPFDDYDLTNSNVLTESPLFDDIEVTVDRGRGYLSTLPIGANFPINDYTPFANVNFDWGTARVYVSKKPEEYMYGDNTHILSNGLWQFNNSIKDRPGWDGKPIKRHFYIDVTPKESVKPEDPGYPFDMNRQRFSTTTNEGFQKIFNYITAIYSQMDYANESKSFGLVQYVNTDGTLTEPKDLTPTTPPPPSAFTMIKPGDEVEVRDGVLYVNNRALPELSPKDLETSNVRVDELIIPQDQIDPNKVMIHDNTVSTTYSTPAEITVEEINEQLLHVSNGWTVDKIKEEGVDFFRVFDSVGSLISTASSIDNLIRRLNRRGIRIEKPMLVVEPKSLSDYARSKFGVRYDKYLVEIGDTFKAIRAALITSSDGEYAELAKEAIGVSIDKEYYGVSIKLPFHGMFINPAATSLYGNPKQTAVSMIGTMLHELAHFRIRSHNADFASEMQRVINLVETHDAFDLQAAKARLTKHIEANQDIFDFLNKEFRDGNITASGNRFKDAGYQQIGNASPVGTVEGARASGEQPKSGVSGSTRPSYQNIGQVGVGAGVTSETEETGEDALRTQTEIDRDVNIALEKVAISKQGEELARNVGILQSLRDPRKLLPAMKQVWKSGTFAQRRLLVRPITMDFLVLWADSNKIPELKNTYKLLQKMGGLTQELLHASSVLAKTVHNAYKEDATLQKKLETIVYASTTSGIDPSNPNADERSPKLDALFTALGDRGQQIYKVVKEHYENMSEFFSQLLDDQIANANISTESKTILMAKIRKIYEAGKKITPYFPLVRRGDFWLSIGQGKHKKFFTFESMAERDAAAEGFAKERRTELGQLKEDGEFVLGNDINSLRSASFNNSDILKELFALVDKENLGSVEEKDALKDSIYQLYLTSMPEQTFRNQFIHRKNTTGFSTDLLRNIATTSTKMSVQLAKVKYSPLLRNSVSAARDSIQGREQLEPFVAEMDRRVGLALNPPRRDGWDIAGDVMNQASFIHYLSGASSALLQPVSVMQVGSAVLGARYGYANTAKELTKMLKVWDQYGMHRTNPDGTTSFVPPSIVNAVGMSPNEKRAIREMMGHDAFQATGTSALFGYSGVATIDYGSATQKGKRAAGIAVGGLLHTTERLSREMLGAAAYRLSYQKLGAEVEAGKMTAEQAHKTSVDNAIRDINESLGNYGKYNRPPVMQRGLGKVLLQFSMFPLHTTLFLLRNFKRTLPLLNKEGKWEATKILYGTLLNTTLIGGITALPMFGMVFGLLNWAWRDEEKPQELKDIDLETWWRTVWLPSQVGQVTIGGRPLSAILERGVANGLSGLDISSRTSLNGMWLRETKETKTAREGALALAMEKAGPFPNQILAYADSYEAFMNGDYQKGFEKASPAAIRNIILAQKYAAEGAASVKGAELLAEGTFTNGEILGQAIGFRSDLLSNTQRVGFKMLAIKQRIENERTKIANNIAREYLTGKKTEKWSGYQKQMENREKFNARYPGYAITDDQLYASLVKRAEERAGSWAGVPMDEKFAPIVSEPMVNVMGEIERREREMGKRK